MEQKTPFVSMMFICLFLLRNSDNICISEIYECCIWLQFQYSWASLVAQLVKNQPLMWETWVRSLGWEDPLEKGKTTHFVILAWRILYSPVHGVAKCWTRLRDLHFHFEYLGSGPFSRRDTREL